MTARSVSWVLAMLVLARPALACDSCPPAAVAGAATASSTVATGSSSVQSPQTWLLPLVQAPGSLPGDPDEGRDEIQVLLEADHLEEDEQSGVVLAVGHVKARYGEFVLSADRLEYHRDESRGTAAGVVTLERGVYHLRCTDLTFDLGRRVADARDWQALVEKQVWLGGLRLHLAPDLVVSEDARISPCLQVDPGYWFAGERFEWSPARKSWNFRGDWVSVVVAGLTVLKLPYLVATVGDGARQGNDALKARDLSLGYNGVQGVTLDGRMTFQVSERPIQLPVRVMSGRGVALGLSESIRNDLGEWRLDGNFTQYWPWLMPASGSVDAGRAGGHLNAAWLAESGPLRSSVNVGYRVDLGRRNDLEYQVDPSGFPVHKLPEVSLSWQGMASEGWSLVPSLRTGYLIEEMIGNGALLLQGGLSLGMPAWQAPGGWMIQPYGGASATAYGATLLQGKPMSALQGSSQSVVSLGVQSTWNWADWLQFRLMLESQPVTVTGNGLVSGTPFVHDRASSVERVLTDLRLHVWGPWSTGIMAWWARPSSLTAGDSPFMLGDLAYRIEYGLNCLGLAVTMRPPRGQQPFQATFDYNVVAF